VTKSISTIFREIDQIKRADIPEKLREAFLKQKHAELAEIGRVLGVDLAAPAPAPAPAAPAEPAETHSQARGTAPKPPR